MLKYFVFIFATVLVLSSSYTKETSTILGYLQLKEKYGNAAWEEGKLTAIKRVLEHRHSKTGKPYPCWNALKPFQGRDLPVSLRLVLPQDQKTEDFLTLAMLPPDKFDIEGKDGFFSPDKPNPQNGFVTWRVERLYQRVEKQQSPRISIGLVDISGSMAAKKKLKTLRGLRGANFQFKKLYVFSGKDSLKEIQQEDLAMIKPEGKTALYENLLAVIERNPKENILVITDGRDNESKLRLKDLLKKIDLSKSQVDVVFTGGKINEGFGKIARESGGEVLKDIHEQGEILEPFLKVYLE